MNCQTSSEVNPKYMYVWVTSQKHIRLFRIAAWNQNYLIYFKQWFQASN